jgi:hypothetical protein
MLALPPPRMLSCRIPFAGFYGTIWEDAYDREQEQLVEVWEEHRRFGIGGYPQALDTIGLDHIRWADLHEVLFDASDFSVYQREMAREYAAEFASWLADSLDLPDLPFEFEEVTSPAYYNFETDRVFAKVSEATLAAIRDQLNGQLADTFKRMFTSRDGFISFYDTEVPTKSLSDWDHNELYALLSAWVEVQLADQRQSIDDVLWDWRISGLYEEVYRAHDAAVDWPKVDAKIAELVERWLEEDGVAEADRPSPRDTQTLELPL